jgi:hypothetical protein
MTDPCDFEAARKKYLPNPIKLIFVAEAPPASDSGRFFYCVPVHKGDTLFLEMIKVLYPRHAGFVECVGDQKAVFAAKQVRLQKAEFLNKFKNDGFYLVDAVENPMPDDANTKVKEEVIRNSLSALTAKLWDLCRDHDTPIILIGAPVHTVCSAALRAAKLRVLNEVSINTPAQGGQKQFRCKLRRILDLHQIVSSDNIPS